MNVVSTVADLVRLLPGRGPSPGDDPEHKDQWHCHQECRLHPNMMGNKPEHLFCLYLCILNFFLEPCMPTLLFRPLCSDFMIIISSDWSGLLTSIQSSHGTILCQSHWTQPSTIIHNLFESRPAWHQHYHISTSTINHAKMRRYITIWRNSMYVTLQTSTKILSKIMRLWGHIFNTVSENK